MTDKSSVEYIPFGYASTMDALRSPDDWDVPGLIADVCENLRRENEVGPGQVLAIIDTLMFRMKDIAELISDGHAKKLNPKTLQEAGDIAAVFCRKNP